MKKELKYLIRRILIVLSLLIAIIISFTILDDRPTFADSGFGTSHSGGSSGGESSGGGSFGGESFGGGSSGGDYNIGIVFGGIFFLISIIIYRNTQHTITNYNFDYYDNLIANKIKPYIPDFNKEEFFDNGYKMYCDIQNAWMNFKLEDVRDILSDELYTMYESQLETLKVKNQQNIVKDFDLKLKLLRDVTVENNTITVTARYGIELYDYIINVKTGKVVKGKPSRKWCVLYEMKFRKTLNENKDWVLTEKKVINQC